MTTNWITIWTTAGMLVPSMLTPFVAQAETLYQRDGVMLEGTASVVAPEAGICQVLKESHSPEVYERMRANHGQPLHVWRLDFAARNGSGRRLEHLSAHLNIASERPPCTRWTVLLGDFAEPVQWANSAQVLQKASGMEPDEEVSDSVFVLTFHDHQPKFATWNVEYRFAAGSGLGSDRAGNGGRSAGGEAGAGVMANRLPPEITADRYLLKAEEAVRDQNIERAREAMEQLKALQRENGLEPPAEDHFRMALVWEATEEPERALESVVRYLQLRGRAAEHYTEALDLMNRVEMRKSEPVVDVLGRGSFEPSVAQTPPRVPTALASSQPSEKSESETVAGGTGAIVRIPPSNSAVASELAGAGASSQSSALVADCGLWGTWTYFEKATAAEVRACLAAGADPHGKQRDLTPLHNAATSSGHPEAIEALVAAGADPNAKGPADWTPLHIAAGSSDHPEVIKALVAAGADPMARGLIGETPLHLAAGSSKHPEVIEALVVAGADPHAKNQLGWTPLHQAVEQNDNAEVVQALEATFSASPESRFSLACKQWGTEEYFISASVTDVRACLDEGVDPMLRDAWGETPLHMAAGSSEHPEIIEVLVAAGADPHAKNQYGRTPLRTAFRRGEYPKVVQALKTAVRGSGQAAKCQDWNTPEYFLRATAADVAACLEQGADLEVKGENRYRPIHTAAKFSNDPHVIQVLVDAGANPQQKLGSRLFGAETHEALHSWLRPLHLAATYNDDPAITSALLKTGANPNSKGGVAASPLHRAAKWGTADVVKVLIDAGADIERSGPKHWIASKKPLHLAAERNSPEVVQVLVDAGANLEALDKHGLTPLHYATEVNPNRAVREALMAAGAGKTERAKAAAAARERSRRGDGRGWGAIMAGATAAAVGAASGLDTAEALKAGASVAGSVLTGQVPVATTGGGVVPGGSGVAGGIGSAGSCLIPGYPSPPGGVANLGFSWCPASVSMQVRAFALQAAGAQCAIATGSSSTPQQVQALSREIVAACGRLAALGVSNCRCPAGFGGPGNSDYPSSVNQAKERREETAQQQEEARQSALIERQARQEAESREHAETGRNEIDRRNAEILSGSCSCIRIEGNGEYTCLDRLVVGSNSTEPPLCDISR